MRPLPTGPAAAPLDSVAAMARMLAPAFRGLDHEELRVLHLDRELRPLTIAAARGGCAVEVPLRALIRDALVLGSRGLVLAHNHPGGDPSPSRADRSATRRIAEAAFPLGVTVVDHLIFAGERYASFAALRLL